MCMKLPSCRQIWRRGGHIPQLNYSHSRSDANIRAAKLILSSLRRKIISEMISSSKPYFKSVNGDSQAGDVELVVVQEYR